MYACNRIQGQDPGMDACSRVLALPPSAWGRTRLGNALAGGERHRPPRLLAEGAHCEVVNLGG